MPINMEYLDSRAACPLIGFTYLPAHKLVLFNISLDRHKPRYFAGARDSIHETQPGAERKPLNEVIE